MVGVLVAPKQKNWNSSSFCLIFSLTSGPKNSLGILMLSCWPECCGWKHRCLMGVRKMRICGRYMYRYIIWSNYSDLTRPHPKWWFSKINSLFQGNLGWWNIIPFGQNIIRSNRLITSFHCKLWGNCCFFSGIPPIHWNPGVYLASKMKIGFQGICDLKMRDLCVPTNQF